MGEFLPVTTPSTIPLGIALVHKDKAVLDADYDRIIQLEMPNAFFDTVEAGPHMSLPALRGGNFHLFVIVALLGGLLIAVMVFAARAQPEAGLGTEYLLAE